MRFITTLTENPRTKEGANRPEIVYFGDNPNPPYRRAGNELYIHL